MTRLLTILLAAVLGLCTGLLGLQPFGAYAVDDDDSGDAGETCEPLPGPCDDQPAFNPVAASEVDTRCDVDGDNSGDIVLVTGDPHDYECWDAECIGTCYQFSGIGSGVWMLIDT